MVCKQMGRTCDEQNVTREGKCAICNNSYSGETLRSICQCQIVKSRKLIILVEDQ